MGSVTVIGSGLPTAKTGAAYATTAVSGGFTPYNYSNVAGSLPAGLTLGTDGRITGTTSAPVGTYIQTITVTDSKGSVTTGTITLNLAKPIATSISLGASSTSLASSVPVTLIATLTATGGTASGQRISFKDGTAYLGSAVTDANGQASFSSSLLGGSHSIAANLEATGVYLTSASSAAVITAAPAL
jgi:hypothetical protein